jgi:hypothetical protein
MFRLKEKKPIKNIGKWFRYKFIESRYLYETTEDLEFVLRDGTVIIVPAGFETDLCSVPPFLTVFMSRNPKTVLAYILHDYLYVNDIRREEMGDEANKKWADEEMLHQALLICPKMKFDSKLRYWAVKKFGHKVYERRASKK